MSILEELYYGNIRPTDEPQSSEVKKALSEVVKMEEALGESLTDKGQKEKISELSERYNKLITLTERDGFLQGFRLGAKLMAELMARTGASDPLFLFIKPNRIRDRISFSLCTEDFSAFLRRQNMRRQSKKAPDRKSKIISKKFKNSIDNKVWMC